MERVVAEQGPNAFQYSSTAGIDELRQWVADRYNKRFGTDYVLDDVLITTGSQQILDLLGKVLLVIFPGRQTNELGAVTGGRDWHRFGAVS